jgi:hypothetical protein
MFFLESNLLKYQYLPISTNETRTKWENICPAGEYRIIPNSTLIGLLSNRLLSKVNSFLVAGSATGDGKVYYMMNANRVDFPAGEIDQMPYGIVYVGNSVAGSACLIHHGAWVNRTITPPNDFWQHISASCISCFYPLSEMPKEPSGKLSDLKVDSQNAAFGNIIEGLQPFVNPDK